MIRGWRRFRPHVTVRPEAVSTDLALAARGIIERACRELGLKLKRLSPERLEPVVELLHARTAYRMGAVAHPDYAATQFALLIMQAPGAVRAQVQMDHHPHGYLNKQERLYELIDFNDSYVSTVLALPESQRHDFEVLARHEMARFCAQIQSPMFREEQFEAITKGLSREIAVYLGALHAGYAVEMTSRAEDAMGVDMTITEPEHGRVINIDCKAPSAYRYRLQDLVREGRMSEAEADRADVRGFAHELNGRGDEQVSVTLMRVDSNEVGEIVDFSFVEPEKLAIRLRAMFASVSQYSYERID